MTGCAEGSEEWLSPPSHLRGVFWIIASQELRLYIAGQLTSFITAPSWNFAGSLNSLLIVMYYCL